MRRSLRFKVALVFSLLTIALLLAQALGVRTLAEAQEERLIAALIQDDMASVLKSYKTDLKLMPRFDAGANGYVSFANGVRIALPASIERLGTGIHEIIVDGREIHVAIVEFNAARLYRIYDFSAYERHFKAVINALMAGTGVFALLTIWLSFGLAGLLVRQVAGLARQVSQLQIGKSTAIAPGKYDETELVGLVHAFNNYHRHMADMIEREKAFAGNVSHELRTPLTTIKTSCELLDQDPSISGKSQARLKQIEQAADKMRELVNALLMLARDDCAHDVEPVELANLIDTALMPFSDRFARKGLEAIVEIDRNLEVVANPSALAIVISNVVDNAVRHTDRGQVRFSYIDGWLHVSDTGPGIPAQALPHVFDRFYQAHAPATQTRGVGIGLSIVKNICGRYGWPIELSSELGRGTRISLRLPLAAP